MLLTLAHRYRNKVNIFLLKPSEIGSFEEPLLSIANNIGSELLVNRHRNQDLHSLWSDLDASQKVEAFHCWLSAEESGKSFLLIDDIDAAPESAIKAALPQEPRGILITTRNPVLVRDLEEEYRLKVFRINLTNLGFTDMVAYTLTRFKNFFDGRNDQSSYTDDHIKTVSQLAVGHPLVASRIVSYVATNLTEQYGDRAVEHFVRNLQRESSFRQIPAAVLTYKPTFQNSIAETFESSRKRLPRSDGPSWTLMQLIAFMVQDDSAFIRFVFNERLWIHEYKHRLFFHDIWSADLIDKQAWMSSLRKVSLGTAQPESDRLCFHPVLIQYVQEQARPEIRTKAISDIMLLAVEAIQRMEVPPFDEPNELSWNELLEAQALHCAKLSAAYCIHLEDLSLPPELEQKLGTFFGTARI